MLGDETTSEISASDSLWLLLAFISTTKVNLSRNMYIFTIVIITIKLNKIYQKKYFFYLLKDSLYSVISNNLNLTIALNVGTGVTKSSKIAKTAKMRVVFENLVWVEVSPEVDRK